MIERLGGTGDPFEGLGARRRQLRLRIEGILALGMAIAACGLTYNAGPVHLAIFLPLLLATVSLPPPLAVRSGLILASAIGGAVAFTYYAGAVVEVLGHALRSASAEVAQPGLTVADLGSG